MNSRSDHGKPVKEIFDYVIVGAGPSAMGILRGLLEARSESSIGSIAIVERGEGPPHDMATISPHRWYEAANPVPNSNAKSAQLLSSEILGRVIDLPVGQGLGGTSNINACLCMPPLQQDLESWPEPHRSTLLSHSNYLVGVMEEQGAIHRTPIHDLSQNPFSQTNSPVDFYETVETLVSRNAVTGKFVRKNYFDGLVEPMLEKYPTCKHHFQWFRGYEAQRLLLGNHGTRVVGVECLSICGRRNPEYREFHARRRVILCTGALETPALLLLSNLGDKDPLFGVGQNLQDQALLAKVVWTSQQVKTSLSSPNGIAALGHLSTPDGGLFQLAITDSVADAYIVPSVVATAMRWRCQNSLLQGVLELVFRSIQVILKYSILCTPLGFLLDRFTITTMLFLMHPKSKGSVSIVRKQTSGDLLTTRRKDVNIKADPNYMSDRSDALALRSVWDALESGTPFEVFPRLLFSPFQFIRSKTSWFESYCRWFLLPYYHFAGTCAMVSTRDDRDRSDWVVDASLKLRGHDGLYICDASVFPSMISNPPALTCAALGYGFSKIILVEDDIKSAK